MAPIRLAKKEINEIIEDIHCKLYVCDFENALKIADDLISKCPNNAAALEAKAYVLHEMNDDDQALKLLNESIAREPFSNFEKYFVRGQITSGEQAMNDYKKAVELLEIEISKEEATKDQSSSNGTDNANMEDSDDDNWEDVNPDKNLKRSLSKVYCQIACQIFSKSDENGPSIPNDELLSSLENAKKADPTNPETYGLLSQYYFLLGNREEAKNILESSRSMWDSSNSENYEDIELNIVKQICEALISSNLFVDANKFIENLLEEESFYFNLLSAKLLYHQANGQLDKVKEFVIEALKCSDDVDEGDADEAVDFLGDVNEEMGLALDDGLDFNEMEELEEGEEDLDDEAIGDELEAQLLARALAEEMDDE